jgi:hypothetical protein
VSNIGFFSVCVVRVNVDFLDATGIATYFRNGGTTPLLDHRHEERSLNEVEGGRVLMEGRGTVDT